MVKKTWGLESIAKPSDLHFSAFVGAREQRDT